MMRLRQQFVLMLLILPISGTCKTLNIATIDIVPAGYKNNGVVTGAFYDIGNEIAKRANLTYVNKLKPYTRVIHRAGAYFAFFFSNTYPR